MNKGIDNLLGIGKETTQGVPIHDQQWDGGSDQKTFVVYFHGKIEINADSAREAEDEAYGVLDEIGAQFTIQDSEEI